MPSSHSEPNPRLCLSTWNKIENVVGHLIIKPKTSSCFVSKKGATRPN
jgi:hypothetical protein